MRKIVDFLKMIGWIYVLLKATYGLAIFAKESIEYLIEKIQK